MTRRKKYLALLSATAIVALSGTVLTSQEVQPSSLVDDLFNELDNGAGFSPNTTARPAPIPSSEDTQNGSEFPIDDVVIDAPIDAAPEPVDGPQLAAQPVIPGGTPVTDGDQRFFPDTTGIDLPMNSTLFDPDLLEVGEGQPYEVDPNGDPLTEQVTRILRQGGLLQRQEEIGRSILLMDRQARFANSVSALLSLIGPDAKIEVAPGVFQDFADTRMGRSERIQELGLQQEVIAAEMSLAAMQHRQRLQSDSFELEVENIVEARLDARVQEERQKLLGDAISEADRIKNEAIVIAQRNIADANQDAVLIVEEAEEIAAAQKAEAEKYFTDLTQELEVLKAEQQERLIALDERERAIEEKEALIAMIEIPGPEDIVQFRVSEIYGTNGRFTAIINRGGQLVRVRPGDRLPDGPVVEQINADGLLYSYLGENYELPL